MVVPMGERHQQTLYLLKKKGNQLEREALRPTLFVPMTGAAEENRQVLPDPTKPTLLNGDFEQGLDDKGFVKGWYYQRKLNWVEEVLAPGGTHYVQFENNVPGQVAHLMQGFAIDGRKVNELEFAVSVALENVLVGPHKKDLPVATVTFYDSDRKELGSKYFGPWQGTMTWKNYRTQFKVPVGSREAIVRIGLFGATGKASFDRVVIRVPKD